MCTTRFNGHLYREMCVQGRGVSSWVVYVQGMYLQGVYTPWIQRQTPPLNGMTDRQV